MADVGFVDIFSDLHKQREEYVKQRDEALRCASLCPDTEYGRAMVNLCKGLELAITGIDADIKAG